MTTLILFTLIFAAVANAFFGLTVLLRTYNFAYGRYFGLTMAGVVLWTIGGVGLLFADGSQLVRFSAMLFYIAPMLAPIGIWFFGLTFLSQRPLPKAALISGWVFFVLLASLFIVNFDFFIQKIAIDQPLNDPIPAMPGFLIYAVYFSVFFLFAYFVLASKLRRFRGLSRTQVSYIFWGLLLGSILALVSNLSLPIMGVTDFIWLGPFFTLIFASVVTVAIIRHRLFNMRLVLARTIGYLLSVVSLAGAYGFITFMVVNEAIFSGATVSTGQQITYTFLAASLAFTFHPVRRFFDKLTNRLFYRDAYDPQVFIDQLNRSLVSYTDLDKLLTESAKLIRDNFRAEFCLFGVPSPADDKKPFIVGSDNIKFSAEDLALGQRLITKARSSMIIADDLSPEDDRLKRLFDKNEVALLVRLSPDRPNSNDELGYIVMGNKKSGNPYTRQDVKMFEILANGLTIALQNAYRFEEIKRFNLTLQDKVDNATKQLRRKNERLRVLDQTKDDFISMASHQLRTPLTSVKGYVSMVLEGDAGKISSLQRKLLNQSFVSSQRMVYLISDLLNVSRLRTGKFVVEPVKSNLAAAVENEVEQLQETAKGRDLELVYHKPEHFPTLMLDETKLRQVIMNFIDNAIYYTPSGGKIEVTLADKPQSVEFTVTDTGIGVPKRDQPHLFTKFFRAHNAQIARPDGTGLGLFMAKKVVLAQGGAIIFKSRVHKGSTFGFTLPKQGLEVTSQKITG